MKTSRYDGRIGLSKMKFTNLTTTVFLILALAFPAVAQEKKVEASTPASKGTSDKMDLKKLEDKYWSSKDDDYGVIQNRTFAKTGRIYGSAVYGPLINDPFAKGRAAGAMIGYYLNEDFGVEFSYLSYSTSKNDTVAEYESLQNPAFMVSPNYNLVKATKALSLTYTPFYAKMAFMNKAIMYFDMGFTLGAGLTDYEQQKISKDGGGVKTQTNEMASSPHFEIGVMQQLFLNQSFAFRLDIKNSFYTQTVKQYEIGNAALESTRSETSKSINDTTITFGLTVFFTK
ncbi:MAG: hypothetical protein A2622_01360 [Bdellovibrionales bacterium RIFCSPHIGHO2_01_FULL_40_29]|nr:MAG: hypothetical protein A2622_01360 [Bdellovibrionales bacterium RIFCSPHIGHO2_01_FULL_40_29]OFZ32755.1 MAG: hypothetical protein A3D17_05960 [Bdellovibrionales bacterium RIFCSPHIGHO2_02_FULL_40_15]